MPYQHGVPSCTSESALNLHRLAALKNHRRTAHRISMIETYTTLDKRATMKRKLNNNNVPTGVSSGQSDSKGSDFIGLGLEPRLLQAVVKQSWSKPTLVQSKAIPLALEGKDILGKFLYRFHWSLVSNTTDAIQPVQKLALERLGRTCSQYFSQYSNAKP